MASRRAFKSSLTVLKSAILRPILSVIRKVCNRSGCDFAGSSEAFAGRARGLNGLVLWKPGGVGEFDSADNLDLFVVSLPPASYLKRLTPVVIRSPNLSSPVPFSRIRLHWSERLTSTILDDHLFPRPLFYSPMTSSTSGHK